MAMLAPKTPFSSSAALAASALPASGSSSNAVPGSGSLPSNHTMSRRALPAAGPGQAYISPTDSDFSDSDGLEAIKSWDEDKVCDYLRNIKCGDYDKLFKMHHINGENLLEMDKSLLIDMGIDKVGDRVRLFLGIKKLRNKAHANQKRRNWVLTSPT